MRHHIDLCRWRAFLILSSTWAILSCVASAFAWEAWRLDVLSRTMGVHEHPIAFGLLIAMVPTYLTAIEIWLPIIPGGPSSRRAGNEGMRHWDAVRLVAVLCIFMTELVVDTVSLAVPAIFADTASNNAENEASR